MHQVLPRLRAAATVQSGRRRAMSTSAAAGASAGHPLHQQPQTAQPAQPDEDVLEVTQISETQAYRRYLTVFDRRVQIADARTGTKHTVAYDVVGHPQCSFTAIAVLPFHRAGGADRAEPHVTLIREFHQGPGKVMYTVPMGGFDAKKHATVADCVRAELSEEAMLCGGELVQLPYAGHPGFAEVKWCANRVHVFVAIDPQVDPTPKTRDPEEHIQVVRLGVSRLRELMASGELVMGSTLCCLLALQHLEARGLVPPASSCVAAGGTGDGSSHSNGTGAAAAAADHS